jgi:hypothetical protein
MDREGRDGQGCDTSNHWSQQTCVASPPDHLLEAKARSSVQGLRPHIVGLGLGAGGGHDDAAHQLPHAIKIAPPRGIQECPPLRIRQQL